MATQTILIADEDTDTRVILRTLLERHRYAVIEAASASEAIAHTGSSSVDLIILNYPMHTPDGRPLVRCLRGATATERVPILNLTSRVVPQFLQDAAAEGVTVTLAKPVDVSNFVRVVHELIDSEPAALLG